MKTSKLVLCIVNIWVYLAGTVRRHISQIKQGDLVVLLRKSRSLLLIIPAFVAAVFVRLLKPWLLIRFGPLPAERIGHFSLDVELYCCARKFEKPHKRVLDFLYYYNDPKVSNYQLKKMWDRVLPTSAFARELDRINRFLPGYQNQTIPMLSGRNIDGSVAGYSGSRQRNTCWLLSATEPHICFTLEEEKKGKIALGKMGIPEGAPFVCIYGRDSLYLKTMFPEKQWRYHDYRDSAIENYLPAADELTRRGYFVIRMGYIVEKELNSSNPMVIDYAAKKLRTDFLDIYLCAKCQFFLGVLGGIVGIPMIFRRPIAGVDSIPIDCTHSWSPHDISIIKKLWSRKERRFLTLAEIFDSGAANFLTSEQYEQMNIEVVSNTAQEIAALAVEMEQRIKGLWQDTKEDKELQQRFWSFFKTRDPEISFDSRIGAEFLRQNQELLGSKNWQLAQNKSEH